MRVLTTLFGYLMGPLILLAAVVLLVIQGIAGNPKLFDKGIKRLSRAIPAAFGIRVKCTGTENIDRTKAQIFMANHVNLFDPMILQGHIPVFVRGVELESHFSWPIYGFIIRRLGNIPISHTDVASALVSLEKAREALAAGTYIAILPEGHRTRDGRLGPFKRGSFRFAKEAGADIVPVAMKGLWERKSVHSRIVSPGPVEVVFAPPVTAEELEGLTERGARDRVRDVISGMLGEEGNSGIHRDGKG